MRATSGTRGSSGFGSHRSEQMESRTADQTKYYPSAAKPVAVLQLLLFILVNYLMKGLHIHYESLKMAKHTFRNSECRWPLWSEDVETNAAVTVDVWVVYFRIECNLWKEVNMIWKMERREWQNTHAVGAQLSWLWTCKCLDGIHLTFGGLKG